MKLVPPSSSNAVQQYIAPMRTAHSLGTHTAEATFYTPFANLLNTIGERLKPRVHFQAIPARMAQASPTAACFRSHAAANTNLFPASSPSGAR